MEFTVLGWPEDGPTLRLDYRTFSYAGKFVMSNTGKAVARSDAEEDAGEGEGGVGNGGDGESGAGDAGGDGDGGEDETILAAVAFNEDRTDPDAMWLRYVTVRADRRGDGLGARLAAFAADRIRERGYSTVRIAVNNPFAYQALYKAGFGYTGERTGLAELVLVRPGDRSRATYQSGLDEYRSRDGLSEDERSFLASKRGADAPDEVGAR